jgi:hypothetical protein
MDPKLPPDFVDLLTEFDTAEVRYLVIGGYAVGFHDRPRATKDLDLLVGDDADNVSRACDALAAFGASAAIVESFRAAKYDDVVWFGVPPARVDLLKSAEGIEFASAYGRRAHFSSGGVMVPVVAIEDLIAMKRAAGRDQDRVDVKKLERRLKR